MQPTTDEQRASPPHSSTWNGAGLLLVLLVAAALRFWRLTWGLDETRGWFNEEIVFTAPASNWVPLSWQSLDTTHLLYPPLYSYLAGATTALAHLVGLQPKPGMFELDTVLTSRIPSALAGIATVWITGRLASRLYAETGVEATQVGLVAAALLATAPLHVMDSHIAGADVLLTFAVALTMAAAFALVVQRSPERALLAGMAAGFAFAAKQTGFAMAAPVAWACAEAAYDRRSFSVFVAFGALALVGFLAVWALCCPPCLIHFDQFWDQLATHSRKMALQLGVVNHLEPSLGWLGHPFIYELGASLPYALGWPLYGLTLVGVASALWRHQRAERLVLATIGPYFLFIGSATVTFPRYLLPLFPGLIVLGARPLCPARGDRWGWRAAILACILGYSLVLTITQVARFSTSQRREVAQFAVASVRASRSPARATAPIRVAVPALVEGMDYFRLNSALMLEGAKPVAANPGKWFETEVDAFIVPHWMSIFARRDAGHTGLVRDLERLESGEAGFERVKRFRSWYLQSGFYTRLDPGFYGDLWQGDIGYDVYVRSFTPPAAAPLR